MHVGLPERTLLLLNFWPKLLSGSTWSSEPRSAPTKAAGLDGQVLVREKFFGRTMESKSRTLRCALEFGPMQLALKHGCYALDAEHCQGRRD